MSDLTLIKIFSLMLVNKLRGLFFEIFYGDSTYLYKPKSESWSCDKYRVLELIIFRILSPIRKPCIFYCKNSASGAPKGIGNMNMVSIFCFPIPNPISPLHLSHFIIGWSLTCIDYINTIISILLSILFAFVHYNVETRRFGAINNFGFRRTNDGIHKKSNKIHKLEQGAHMARRLYSGTGGNIIINKELRSNKSLGSNLNSGGNLA